jgi:hypothetical protein
MKKEYSKPIVVFENFSLSTNIAGTCEGIVNNPSRGTCAVLGTGNIAVFDSGVTGDDGCVYTPGDLGGKNDEWDGFCYHVPTEYNNLFNS